MSGTPYAVDSNLQVFGGLANAPDPIGSDGIVPKKFWVSVNGTNGDSNGRPDAPFRTITFALGKCVTARGDTIFVGPGSYAETVDVDKAYVSIIGTGGRHNGITQIVGDGTTARATVRVLEGFLGGFTLKNVELDVTTVTQPALHLETDNTTAGTQANLGMRFLIDNVAVRSAQPNVGILLEGAQVGKISRITMRGPTIGIALCGSTNNTPEDIDFEDIDFRDCVTADIATVDSAGAPTVIAARVQQNLSFLRMRHWDRGGTPVTNYVNFPNIAGVVNVHFFECVAARDVADDTLLALPADVVWIGRSAAGAEFIIGA